MFASLAGPAAAPASGRVLRLAAENFPPFSHADDGRPGGLDWDVVRTVLQGLGHEAELSVMPWKRAFRDVAQGNLDAVIGGTRGDLNEREELLAFPDEPLSASFSRLYFRRSQPFVFDGLFTLKGMSVAVVAGYSLPPDFTAAGYFTRQAVSTHERCLQMLLAGRVDLALVHAGVAEHLIRRRGWRDQLGADPTPIAPGQLYVCFSRQQGHEALAGRFGRALRHYKASRAYALLLDSYGIPADTLKGVPWPG